MKKGLLRKDRVIFKGKPIFSPEKDSFNKTIEEKESEKRPAVFYDSPYTEALKKGFIDLSFNFIID